MGYLSEGMTWGLRPSFLRSLRSFEHKLGCSHGNMQLACNEFFRLLDYQVQVIRPWNLSSGSILFVSDHDSALDGFAIPLACPSSLTIRRVVFHLSALVVGREFTKHSVVVWPRGNYQNLLFESQGVLDRVAYLITHRWGPWVRSGRALGRMIQTLQAQESLMLLPSGTVGDRHWRRGVGALIQAVPDTQPCFLAPVYLDWDQANRRVRIEAPRLLNFSDIKKWSGSQLDSLALASWMEKRYRNRDWSEFG